MGAGGASGGAQVGLGAFQMLEAKNQASAMKRQAEFEARQLEFNSQLVQIQKREILDQAETDVQRRQSEVKKMLGSQKVSLAAQGVDVSSDVAQDIEREERRVGVEDVQTIKNNAWREAMGLEIKSQDLKTQAKFTRLAGKEGARSTLVTGGLNAASSIVSGAGRF